MFSSKNLVSTKGDLGAIRIAAYFYKRLKKPHVNDTDISSAVDKILQDELQAVTYRVLGYLLLGIVRIYSKKVEYLLDDCQEVLLGINNFPVHRRQDLPAETQQAPYFSITLPECFELDAFDLEVLDDNIEGNVVPLEQITLKDSMLENPNAKENASSMCVYEDVAGSYYPCSAKYSPFEDVLSTYGIDVNLRKLLNIDGLTTTLDTIQENRFSQQECTDLVVLDAVEEQPQNADNPLDEDHQDNAGKIKVPDGLSSKLGVQAEASTEKLQDSDENSMNLVRSSEIEGEPADCVNQHGEDCQIGREQIMVSEPEQLENEVLEVIRQDCAQSNLQVEMEKLRDDRCSRREQLMDLDMLCGPKEHQGSVNSFIEENHMDGEPRLHEISENRETGEDNSISTKPDRTPDIETPYATGAATPRLMGIPTPARKERARISRKRKCVFDETITLPNEVLKRSIHDASDLVSKRRKVAYTALADWRASCTFPRDFFESSLVTGISPELRSLYCGKKLKMMKSTKTVVPPKALEIPKITVAGITEKIGIAPETPIKNSAGVREQINIAPVTPIQSSSGTSEQIGIAPETPVQHLTTANPFECPMSPGTPNYESVTPSLFDCPRMDPSPGRDEELDLRQMDEVTNLCPEDTREWRGWSGRTRNVAKYLHRSFLNRMERAGEEMLNLSQIVEGRTKNESARVFYEILVLSSKGCLDVKQDAGYSDILIRKLQKLDQTCDADDMISC